MGHQLLGTSQLLWLFEEEYDRCGVLQDAAGGSGGCACDGDVVGFGRGSETVCCADAVPASGGEQKGGAEECESGKHDCFATIPGAKGKESDGEQQKCPGDG